MLHLTNVITSTIVINAILFRDGYKYTSDKSVTITLIGGGEPMLATKEAERILQV